MANTSLSILKCFGSEKSHCSLTSGTFPWQFSEALSPNFLMTIICLVVMVCDLGQEKNRNPEFTYFLLIKQKLPVICTVCELQTQFIRQPLFYSKNKSNLKQSTLVHFTLYKVLYTLVRSINTHLVTNRFDFATFRYFLNN